jgi:hypothetical protein
MQMTIEAQLERIANALEAIAAGSSETTQTSTSSTKPAPSQEKSSKKPSKKSSAPKESKGGSESTKDDVREALKNLQKAKGAAAARDLLAENKAKTLTDLDAEMYSSVIEAAEERARG